MSAGFESILRDVAPQVVAALVRRFGDFYDAEDAAQDALLAAAQQWPREGVPQEPRAWVIKVASRRLIDRIRSDSARRSREIQDHNLDLGKPDFVAAQDDSLVLMLLCCHPTLPRTAQVPLTLRAVGGLTTAQIAHLLLVPEPTVAQRISRAKSRLREAGARFEMPTDMDPRMSAVLQVLYLVFTQAHHSQASLPDAATEAIRLTRMLRGLRPQDGEVAGLLALMLLTHARQGAQRPDELVPLAQQDRTQWDSNEIREGVALLEAHLGRGSTGPYAVQAAIAAVHAEAATWEQTDWPQILALYDLLVDIAPGPVTSLNRAVAVAMVQGPLEGLKIVADIADSRELRGSHRVPAVRAHLLEMAGDHAAAKVEYARAAERADQQVERDYLILRGSAMGITGQ